MGLGGTSSSGGIPAGEASGTRLRLLVERLGRVAAIRDLEAGELVFQPAFRSTRVYLVESGLIRLFRSSRSGHELTSGYAKAGDLIGEVAALLDEPLEGYAEACRSSRVRGIPRRHFVASLRAQPDALVQVLQRVARHASRNERRLEDLALRDARGRVAAALVELAQYLGQPDGEGDAIWVPITQTELASYTAVTRQTVNLLVQELRREGLLAQSRRGLVLLAPAALERVAAPAG